MLYFNSFYNNWKFNLIKLIKDFMAAREEKKDDKRDDKKDRGFGRGGRGGRKD